LDSFRVPKVELFRQLRSTGLFGNEQNGGDRHGKKDSDLFVAETQRLSNFKIEFDAVRTQISHIDHQILSAAEEAIHEITDLKNIILESSSRSSNL